MLPDRLADWKASGEEENVSLLMEVWFGIWQIGNNQVKKLFGTRDSYIYVFSFFSISDPAVANGSLRVSPKSMKSHQTRVEWQYPDACYKVNLHTIMFIYWLECHIGIDIRMIY